jgi:hypothetical protein
MNFKFDGQWICFIQRTPKGIVTHKFRKIDVQPWGRLLLLALPWDDDEDLYYFATSADHLEGVLARKEGRRHDYD